MAWSLGRRLEIEIQGLTHLSISRIAGNRLVQRVGCACRHVDDGSKVWKTVPLEALSWGGLWWVFISAYLIILWEYFFTDCISHF